MELIEWLFVFWMLAFTCGFAMYMMYRMVQNAPKKNPIHYCKLCKAEEDAVQCAKCGCIEYNGMITSPLSDEPDPFIKRPPKNPTTDEETE